MSQKPWTKQEVALLGTATDREIAEHIGRTPNAVEIKRKKLRIPSFTRFQWTPKHIRQLGKKSDAVLAEAWGLTRLTVIRKRQELGIECANPQNRPR